MPQNATPIFCISFAAPFRFASTMALFLRYSPMLCLTLQPRNHDWITVAAITSSDLEFDPRALPVALLFKIKLAPEFGSSGAVHFSFFSGRFHAFFHCRYLHVFFADLVTRESSCLCFFINLLNRFFSNLQLFAALPPFVFYLFFKRSFSSRCLRSALIRPRFFCVYSAISQVTPFSLLRLQHLSSMIGFCFFFLSFEFL